MLSWSAWANIAQEKYLYNVGPFFTNNFAQKKSTTLSGSVWANITQGSHLCNVSPWLTDNFYEENNLYKVVSTTLGQYCIGILSSQRCPNTSERTLYKKITCAMLAQSSQQWFWKKKTYLTQFCLHLRGPRLHKTTCEMQKQPPEVFCKKKVFLKILQYLQESTCVGVFF